MTQDLQPRRRGFLAAAATFAATPVAALNLLSPTAARAAGAAGSGFGTIKQIEAGVLNVGYAEAGPADGPPVVLLHGWPYDIHTYVDVAPLLAQQGYRVIVPFLRGYGSTRFLSGSTVRTGQPAAVAQDIVSLMDALGIRRAIVAGCDWGARTACAVAVLWPDRVEALVSVSGYLLGNRDAGRQPLTPQGELSWWYQFYLSTERGRLGYDKYRVDFSRLIWQQASPQWRFDEATFQRSAAAFENPDHVAIVVHNYRWRLSLADGEARYDALEAALGTTPPIRVPAITLEGDANGAPHLPPAAYAAKFAGSYEHRNLGGGIGHNLPQEAPEAFAKAVIDAGRLRKA